MHRTWLISMVICLVGGAASCGPDDSAESDADTGFADLGGGDEEVNPSNENPYLELERMAGGEHRPCGQVTTLLEEYEDTYLFGWDEQDRLVIRDLLPEEGSSPFLERLVWTYANDDPSASPSETLIMGWEEEVNTLHNGMYYRTVWELDSEGRPSGYQKEGSPFLGTEGVVRVIGTIVYYSDTSWIQTEDVGIDLGSAGDGSLYFDGVPDETTVFEFNPVTLTLSMERDSGAIAEFTFRSAPESLSIIVSAPIDLPLDLESTSVDMDGDGTVDYLTEYEYDETGRLLGYVTSTSEGDVFTSVSYLYECE